MSRCRRCDFQATRESEQTPLEQLADHALDSSHPLCVCCSRSLTDEETQTCLSCVSQTRRDLADIVDLYRDLPGSFSGVAVAVRDGMSKSTEDTPIPGGDAMVLLAPGSEGRSEDAETWRAKDPPSASALLGQWEDDWRLIRGESAAPNKASVDECAGYLGKRVTWASEQHPAFDEFAEDMRGLCLRLQRVLARDDQPVRAPVLCFRCEKPGLERAFTDHGLDDTWRCRKCQRVYSPAEYLLAVRAKLEKDAS